MILKYEPKGNVEKNVYMDFYFLFLSFNFIIFVLRQNQYLEILVTCDQYFFSLNSKHAQNRCFYIMHIYVLMEFETPGSLTYKMIVF
jgi:hypothetical protein